MISAFGLPVGLSLLFSLALCVHVVRSGAPIWWLLIIILLQPLGGLVYLLAIVLPQMAGGATARRFSAGARAALDPGREYREARQALDEAPTVHNQMRLAKAAAAQGRHEEAETLYRDAAQGVHADDPSLLLGRALALIELDRYEEALAVMQRLETVGEEAHAPAAALAMGRIFEGLGRFSEAERAYETASERLPGLEGIGRYAAFLARTGRKGEAREAIAEMDRRIAKANPQFRREGRVWRDLAAQALASA
ncbi:MAG TPA: tetratricopeptide repeat protein [Caulobacteraceae bacterium]|nr:tetratricopeptide repeat protein [Caulobacteraceae bacterium]